MATIIDTNILYSLLGISSYSENKKSFLANEITKFKPLFISELTVLEIFTHKSFSDETIKNIFEYIVREEISFVNFLDNENSILIKLKNGFDLNRDDFMLNIKNDALKIKKKIEAGILPLLIVLSVLVVALFYDRTSKDDDSRKKLVLHLNSLLEGNIDFIRTMSIDTIDQYYIDPKMYNFKDEVKYYILTFLYVLTINHSLSDNGLLLSDLNINNPDLIDTSFLDQHRSSDFRNHIIRKMKGRNLNGLFSKKEHWSDLDKSLKTIENILTTTNNEFNYGVIKYYLIYIKDMLISDKKFEKNNLIDSQFHEYDGVYNFLTIDETLFLSYKEIFPKIYTNSSELANQLKA